VAIGAVEDAFAPAFAKTFDGGKRIGHAGRKEKPAAIMARTIGGRDNKSILLALGPLGIALDPGQCRIGKKLLARLAGALAWHGAFRIDNLAMSALAIIPALAGMWAGQIIRNRVSPATFRRWFLVCLLVLGAEMVIKALL